ncbi:MAG: TadE/TadG family type IV pilus assembly protein [Roseobacter sp.]
MKKRFFMKSEEGSIAIEAVIMIPLLIWAYLAMFTIFDSFRQYTTQQKAVYTISDLISRQATPLDAAFIDGLHSLFENLSRTPNGSGIRVTVAKYDLLNEQYDVVWSRVRGEMVVLQSADVADWTNRLPVMPQDDQIIIVETTADFTPLFEVGLSEQTINNFVFTRPRYANQLCFETVCS